MALETTSESTLVLRALDALIEGRLREPTARAATTARARLAALGAPFAWAVVPAEGLPAPLRSAFVFVVRAGARPEPHRHPNSAQHLRSLAGAGRVVLNRPGAVERSGRRLDAARPWLVIGPDVIHAVRSEGGDWVVASFHTVAAEELEEVTESGARRYA